MQLTKLYTCLIRLTSKETIDREAILTALKNMEKKKLDAIQSLENLIPVVIYEWANKTHKTIEATDEEIASVRDFLSSFSQKLSSTVPDKHVEAKQQELPWLHYNLPPPSSSADRKLEQIKLSTFSGDKTKCEYVWTAFESVIDNSDKPAKYKVIRLMACLQGKAEESVSKLGCLEEACEKAKNTLKRSFHAQRRKL